MGNPRCPHDGSDGLDRADLLLLSLPFVSAISYWVVAKTFETHTMGVAAAAVAAVALIGYGLVSLPSSPG